MPFGASLFADHAFWQAIGVTLRLATWTTLLLLLIGLPIAYWLNFTRSRFATLVQSIVALPLALPPSVIGFYLLVILAPGSLIGSLWIDAVGVPLTFSFAGLVVGSVIYSFPFAVQPFQTAFRGVDPALLDAAAALGANPMQRFFRILLPQARRGIAAGATLTFAHTVGEFGVVLMLGGNIPGQTRVASIALYDEVQRLNYPAAHGYALTLVIVSFLALLLMNLLQRRA